jgi:aryl-alcohol dehydrogenase-like predicted oxidoreductase
MRTISIQNDLLTVSVIALGASLYGSMIPEAESFALLDDFAAGGGNLLDTAHIYAAWLPEGTGQSERTIGRWLRKSGLTSRITVATKGCHPRLETMDQHRVRPECIAQDLSESLERLQCTQVGIYFLHRDAADVPVGELLTALEDQRRAGRIVAYGASNWSVARLTEAATWAREHGIPGFVLDQPGWSLAERRTDKLWDGVQYGNQELLDWHRATGLATMAYSSQATGWFAKDVPDYDTVRNRARRERAQILATGRNCTPTQIAVAWLTNQSFPGIAVVGPRTREQLADSLKAGAIRLTPEECTYLEA